MINENGEQKLKWGWKEEKKKKKNAYCIHIIKPLGTG